MPWAGRAPRSHWLRREPLASREIDAALEVLVKAAPQLKKRILEACAACICVDGTVTIEEGELLRAVSDSLGCPMPPLIASGVGPKSVQNG